MTTTLEPRDGATAIAEERARQISSEGYTREHDVEHGPKELIDAALAYTVQAQDRITDAAGQGVGADGPESYWPWNWNAFRPDDDELRSLAKAGALLAAAYDAAIALRASGDV